MVAFVLDPPLSRKADVSDWRFLFSSSTTFYRNTEHTHTHMETVPIHKVDEWLRFNKYIRTGYRAPLTWRQGLGTLFTIHNETINVWSHLVPAILLMYLAIVNQDEFGWIYSACNFTSSVVFWASAAYHLFMPCCASHSSYLALVNCDVLACLLSVTTTSLSFIYYGNRCASTTLQVFGTVVMLLSAAMVTYVVLVTKMSAAGRVKLFGIHCMLRLSLGVVIMWPKVSHHGFEQSFYYHVTSFFILGGGGFVNGKRIPERWFPDVRWLDFLLNSHNLWHYLCVIAAVSTSLGCYYDHVEFDATVCY
jgi:adiponectin receptor